MAEPHRYKDAIKEIDATSGRARTVLDLAQESLKFLETEGRLARNMHIDWLSTSDLIAGRQGRILGEDQYATVAELDLPRSAGHHPYGYIVKTYNIENNAAAETAISNLTMTFDSRLQHRLPKTVGYFTPTDDTISVYTERKPFTGDALLMSIRKALKEKTFADRENERGAHPQDILSMVYLLQSYINVTNDVWKAGYKYADLKWENLGFELNSRSGQVMDTYHSTIIDVGHLEPHDGWRDRIQAAGLPLNSVRAFNPFYSPERMIKAARMREELISMTPEMVASFGNEIHKRLLTQAGEEFNLRDCDPTIMTALAIADATDGIYDSIRAHPAAYKDDVLGAVLDARAALSKGVTLPVHPIFAPVSFTARMMSNEHVVNAKQMTLDQLTRDLEGPMMEALDLSLQLSDSPYMRERGVDLQAHIPTGQYAPTLNKTQTLPNPNKTVVVNCAGQQVSQDVNKTVVVQNTDLNKTSVADEPKFKFTMRGKPGSGHKK